MHITHTSDHAIIGGTLGSVILYPDQEFHGDFLCADGTFVQVSFTHCHVFYDVLTDEAGERIKVGSRIAVCPAKYRFLRKGRINVSTSRPVFIWHESKESMYASSLERGLLAVIKLRLCGVRKMLP